MLLFQCLFTILLVCFAVAVKQCQAEFLLELQHLDSLTTRKFNLRKWRV